MKNQKNKVQHCRRTRIKLKRTKNKRNRKAPRNKIQSLRKKTWSRIPPKLDNDKRGNKIPLFRNFRSKPKISVNYNKFLKAHYAQLLQGQP